MLNILKGLICRTPAFGVNDDLENTWDELKILIKESSLQFYNNIEHVSFSEISLLDYKSRFTIWKYFNRGRLRQTPFNGFAAISLIDLNKTAISDTLIIDSEKLSTDFIDWSLKDNIQKSSFFNLTNETIFITNSTVIFLNKELRYIRKPAEDFEMANVELSPELEHVLLFCRLKRSYQEILKYLGSNFSLNDKSIRKFILELTELQLLLSNNHPNIIGEDYFNRLKVQVSNNQPIYRICKRKIVHGKVDVNPLNDINEAITFLKNCIPEHLNLNLETFKEKFKKKHEGKFLPLLVALDPEIGIGYGNLDLDAENNFSDHFYDADLTIDKTPESIVYTDFQVFLLNNLLSGTNVSLEHYKVKPKTSVQLPNTLSALYHMYKDHPVVEFCGGYSANALIGRFSVCSTEIEKLAIEIATLESSANPDVLFFDIGYQAETKVDNVNRRKQIYKDELPLLTWSCNSKPMFIDDIFVTVIDDEIVLYSKSKRMRIVPKQASTYNYERSQLAVYLFLCDLQHQGIRSNLTFSIQAMFPGLVRYPRVSYKNVILSPAMWKVPDTLMLKKALDFNMIKTELLDWLNEEKIDFDFQIGIGDQQLTFNPKCSSEINFFLMYLGQIKGNSAYISEALFSAENNPVDKFGKVFSAQYLASFYHNNPVYKPHKNVSSACFSFIRDISYLPGEEWVYFEIYVHERRSKQVILELIDKFTNELKNQIKDWFFIRFNDPQSHIRFRFQVRDLKLIGGHIHFFKTLCEPLWLKGIINDLQIKTYFPEIHRYGKSRIFKVQEVFTVDSKYVIYLLSKNWSNEELYLATLEFFQLILDVWFAKFEDQMKFTVLLSNSFREEFNFSIKHLKVINVNFKKLTSLTPYGINQKGMMFINQYKNISIEIKGMCEESERIAMLADLFHMHVNRLFPNYPRYHEAIIYQYLNKKLARKNAFINTKLELLCED